MVAVDVEQFQRIFLAVEQLLLLGLHISRPRTLAVPVDEFAPLGSHRNARTRYRRYCYASGTEGMRFVANLVGLSLQQSLD